jgi:hypothetical protein
MNDFDRGPYCLAELRGLTAVGTLPSRQHQESTAVDMVTGAMSSIKSHMF